MSLLLDENNARYQIRTYRPGRIQVNDQFFHCSIIISPEKMITDWKPQRIGELCEMDLDILGLLRPAVFILGTGERLIFPPIETYGQLINLGIGVEIMDTRAACRTYQALAADKREVVAGLIIQ